MPAYAVKHIVSDHGPLSDIMKDVRKTPYSYTSKEPEATHAARGGDVYVIEVRAENGGRTYALGYMYRAQEKFSLAGGGRWKGEFKFKNSAVPGAGAHGVYFDSPVLIEHGALREWLASKQPGMAQIPSHLVPALDTLIADPFNGAKRFA